MIRPLLLAATLSVAAPALAEPVAYRFDPQHTHVMYFVDHFGLSKQTGKFREVDGTLMLDTDELANSSVEVTIPVDSVWTGVEKLDEHLKNEDFFAASEHPDITFKSTSVESAGEGRLKVNGDLTIRGVTKPATLDVTVNKIGEHPMSKQPAAGFSATTTIKRSDFGVDYAQGALGDEVKIRIEAETSAQ